MNIWYNSIFDTEKRLYSATGNRVRIGSRPDSDVALNSPMIDEDAAVLYKRPDGWELIVLGVNGCEVDGQEVRGSERVRIECNGRLVFWPFTLLVELPHQQADSAAMQRQLRDQEMTALLLSIHLELLARMDVNVTDQSRQHSREYLFTLERNLDEISRLKGITDSQQSGLLEHIAGHCVRGALLHSLLESAGADADDVWKATSDWSQLTTSIHQFEEELKSLLEHFNSELGLDRIQDLSERINAVDRGYWLAWDECVDDLYGEFKDYLALRYIKKQIKDVVFGYGPLEDLLRVPTISEIMVVDRDHIYIEKNGLLENTGRRFFSDKVTETIIERIVAKVGRRIDKSSPLVDARLTDGSRVNAVIPPLAVSGPCLTIRKFPARSLRVDDLINRNSLSRTVAEFLRAAVITRKNILISGGTGTGKTTILNCLSDFIPDRERIVTVEDTAELRLAKEHVVRLEARPANLEGKGEYTIRDLVKNSLRMRPDRIIVGECRGAEALDMLQAMNTGHDGSMTTIHANTSRDVILRLEVLVQMASGSLPVSSIRQQIAAAIDVIVQLTRLRSGRRIVSQVSQVVGVDRESGDVELKDIFAASSEDGEPKLSPTGLLPTFMDELIESGLIRLESFYI